MTCREAQDRLFSADSGAPPAHGSQQAAHQVGCPRCRSLEAELESALGSWRRTTAATPTPDAEHAWQVLRRRLRENQGHGDASARRGTLAWLTLPIGAVAAAVALFMAAPADTTRGGSAQDVTVASAEAVDAPGEQASTMVFVDEKSGWLIVWASDAAPRRG